MCKSQVITHQAEIGRFDITHFPLPSQISAPENMPFPWRQGTAAGFGKDSQTGHSI